MRRYTTPIHVFELPFSTSDISKVRIIYAQPLHGGSQFDDFDQVLVKELKHCSIDGNTIMLRLTQEDTAKLDCNKRVGIQLHVLDINGQSHVSDPIYKSVGGCFDTEVLQ